ncbi:hypothetical protein [Amycolatopsis australiensis]|uniref:Uncharacterized protein n=1 Tax=Amycolatopsis australiensis TaxID=546364 RepID=A0A1K1SWX7_9PSEU|nr:hypothetical protein [Amycolatopsis australiensis]SFW88795.1 hypothetical protein SAMN04489730_7061 [Amycolatopsis australiensis]
MLFFRIESWRGAACYATWVFFVLYWFAGVLFLVAEPGLSQPRLWSGLIGGLIGWLAGLSAVSDVKKVHAVPPSGRTRATAALMALPGGLLGAWGDIVDLGSSVFVGSIPMFLVPAVPMAGCLGVAGWSLAARRRPSRPESPSTGRRPR